MVFQSVKGTRDFYPDVMDQRKRVFARIRNVADSYGFKELECPAVENFELIKAKSGEEIKQQMFMLEQRGDERIALRAELTPSVARMFIQKQKEIPKPVKWYYLTRMWRYEAPQKGRLREFYQFGVELFGSQSPAADAEVISLAIDVLKIQGLTDDDFVVKVNNRSLLNGVLKSIGIDERVIEEVLRCIDKRSKLSEKDFKLSLSFLSSKEIDSLMIFLDAKSLMDLSVLPLNEEALKGKAELEALFSIMNQSGLSSYICFSPEVARGLAYYTGTVFEGFDKKGVFRAIFGGGRYDNLVSQFGGEATPATGFAMGDVVLELFLRDRELWDESAESVDYYVAPVSIEFAAVARQICRNIRSAGKSAETDLLDRKLSKQLAYANNIKAKNVIFVGSETDSGNVKVKDMKTGQEMEVKISELGKR